MKRADFESIICSKGYDLSNNLNKDVKYLITNDPNSGSTKMLKLIV